MIIIIQIFEIVQNKLKNKRKKNYFQFYRPQNHKKKTTTKFNTKHYPVFLQNSVFD